MNEIKRSAVLSADGRYRYRLSRERHNGPICVFIMLNPSTADAEVDDPTIRRCMGFAWSWGFGRMYVGNLFAGRTPKPSELKEFNDPVGPDNHGHLQRLAEHARVDGVVVAAWGAHGSYMDQDQTVIGWFERWATPLHYLRLTQNGAPSHPLYLPASLTPQRWHS
jgi:hypothetical protein